MAQGNSIPDRSTAGLPITLYLDASPETLRALGELLARALATAHAPDQLVRSTLAHDQETVHRTDRLLVTVTEAAALLSTSRSTIYKLMQQGQLSSIRVGRARRIVVRELEAYIMEQQGD